MNGDEIFGSYDILKRPDGSLEELGRGAMGVTYKARNRNTKGSAVLKVIDPEIISNEDIRERFEREAQNAAAIDDHPNIAKVYDAGHTTRGTLWYAMEFCNGKTVEQLVKEEKRFPWRRALDVAAQVSSALEALAEKDVVHRDIKPSNIMLVPRRGKEIVKLIDFGISKKTGNTGTASETRTKNFIGTSHFASPEQIGNEKILDSRSDIYSLGATLWFMLTGKPPFTGSSEAVIISKHLTAPPDAKRLALVPKRVKALVLRMLQKEREDRPADPWKLMEEIERCLRQPVEGSIFSLLDLLRERHELSLAEVLRLGGILAGKMDAAEEEECRLEILPMQRVTVHFLDDPEKPEARERLEQSVTEWPDFDLEVSPGDPAEEVETKVLDEDRTIHPGMKQRAASPAGGDPVKQLAELLYDLLGRRADANRPRLASLGEKGNVVLRRAADEGTRTFATAGHLIEKLSQTTDEDGFHFDRTPSSSSIEDLLAPPKKKGGWGIPIFLLLVVLGAGAYFATPYVKLFMAQDGGEASTPPPDNAPDSSGKVSPTPAPTDTPTPTKEPKPAASGSVAGPATPPPGTPAVAPGNDPALLPTATSPVANIDQIFEGSPYASWRADFRQWLVARVQSRLKETNYYEGKADANLGPRTDYAIRWFQQHHERPVTGRIDAQMLKDLGLDAIANVVGDKAGERLVVKLANDELMAFRWCPPGAFMMGSPASERAILKAAGNSEGFGSDEYQHQVRLTKGFWMAETLVTQEQWKAVIGLSIVDQANGALADDVQLKYDGKKKQTLRAFLKAQKGEGAKVVGAVADDYPVYYVSWYDAGKFCQSCSEFLAASAPSLQMRLPTEAEYEYACRAGTDTMTYVGDFEIKGPANAPALDPIAWYRGNSAKDYVGHGWDASKWTDRQYAGNTAGPRRVGSKGVNPWGLFDTLGNMWEWCSDYYGPYPATTVSDPQGSGRTPDDKHVERGGSWNLNAAFCRAAARGQDSAQTRGNAVGFRPVLVPGN